jgi:hypothetical protein
VREKKKKKALAFDVEQKKLPVGQFQDARLREVLSALHAQIM